LGGTTRVGRITKLGRVGKVEGLGAEFEIKSLGHFEMLGERQIQREEPGSTQDIAARGAEPDACRLNEAGGAEPREMANAGSDGFTVNIP
jgi:hypothetical protein